MKMIVVHILAQSFDIARLRSSAHHSGGEDILLTTHDLRSKPVGISIKLFCKSTAAMIVEIQSSSNTLNSPYLTASGSRPVEITPSRSICSNVFTYIIAVGALK